MERLRLIEERKRRQANTNMADRMEDEVNLDMQLKIENMLGVKKSKDKKVLRNNPPKKEVHLKASQNSIDFTKSMQKPG